MMTVAPLAQRLIHWRFRVTPETVLNGGAPPADESIPVAAELKRAMNAMKAQAFNLAQGRVNYAALRSSPAYAKYRMCARRLQSYDPGRLQTDAERLAFWINLYNSLVVDAVVAFGVQGSVNEAPGFFWKAAYCVGGQRFSASDIEHGILRAGTGHPAIPGPHFGRRDLRRAHRLTKIDPRIHFALVCAARSCPPIAVYDAERIEPQLEAAARAFVNGGGVEVAGGEVRLSRIFQWYAPDFGGPALGWGDMRPVLRQLSQWVNDESARRYLAAADLRIKYLAYDWSLNG